MAMKKVRRQRWSSAQYGPQRNGKTLEEKQREREVLALERIANKLEEMQKVLVGLVAKL